MSGRSVVLGVAGDVVLVLGLQVAVIILPSPPGGAVRLRSHDSHPVSGTPELLELRRVVQPSPVFPDPPGDLGKPWPRFLAQHRDGEGGFVYLRGGLRRE